MFTGLIEEVGTVLALSRTIDAVHCTIGAEHVVDDLAPDASIAVNGVCLTVTHNTPNTFSVTAVLETLRKTTMASLEVGSHVNLERAVRMMDRLGGHLVQGHVDAVGFVDNVVRNATGSEIWIAFPSQFRKWMIPVGSITVEGVSLTLAEIEENRFKVAIIPHTLERTILSELSTGKTVNLEFDMVAKYLESIQAHQKNS